jgi:hypothetical protein
VCSKRDSRGVGGKCGSTARFGVCDEEVRDGSLERAGYALSREGGGTVWRRLRCVQVKKNSFIGPATGDTPHSHGLLLYNIHLEGGRDACGLKEAVAGRQLVVWCGDGQRCGGGERWRRRMRMQWWVVVEAVVGRRTKWLRFEGGCGWKAAGGVVRWWTAVGGDADSH